MKNQYKNIIGVDWQGQPIQKLTLKDILIQLGAKTIDNKVCFDINNPILNLYPTRLADDGMGYGVDEQYIIWSDLNYDDDGQQYIRIWTESKHSQEEIDNFISDCEEFEKHILANKD